MVCVELFTMKSRISGNIFEYTIASFLMGKSVKCHNEYTVKKMDIWKKTLGNELLKELNGCLTQIFDKKIPLINFESFSLMSDSHGGKGNNTDIAIYEKNNNVINISCKNNNISIKHQRPSGFPGQAKLEQSQEYADQYKTCNDKWFNKLKELTTFDKIDESEKMTMYQDFNDITYNYLTKCNPEQIQNYYNFLISYDRSYIFKLNPKNKSLILYDYSIVNLPTKIIKITKYKQYLEIFFDNHIGLKMRLHNASKRITKSISLKYDTTLININDLYKETIFNY